MMKNMCTILSFGVVILGLCGSGCAVLRVDVDVYKGPLANHQHVQTQQLAAMAMGAKPMLVDLRDQLEVAKRDEYGSTKDLRQKMTGWKAGFVNPLADGRSPFQDDGAYRVNEILSLYEDLGSAEERALLLRGRDALQRYRDAYYRLRPTDVKAEDKVWKQIAETQPTGENRNKDLWEAFGVFITETTSSNGQPVHQRSARRILQNAKTAASERDADGELKGALDASANARFEFLLDHLEQIVDELDWGKGEGQTAARAFLTRVVRDRANAFLDAREALRDLLTVCLDGLILINSDTHNDGRPSPASYANRAIYEFVLNITQTQFIIVCANKAGMLSGLTAEGRDIAALATTDNFPFEAVKPKLLRLFLADPKGMAEWLKQEHQNACEKPTSVAGAQPRELQYESGWRFGLVRGPTGSASPVELGPDAISGAYSRSIGVLGGVLGGGRLEDGLETLMENYVRAVHGAWPDIDVTDVRRERLRLSNALVRFAEKLLFIANHDSLLNRPTRLDGIVGKPSVLIGHMWSKVWHNIGDSGSYVQVLQAVGNSILIQADELTHRDSHGTVLRDGYGREMTAAAQTYSGTAEEIYSRYLVILQVRLAQVNAGLEELPADSKAALEMAVMELRNRKTAIVAAAGGNSASTPWSVYGEIQDQLKQAETEASGDAKTPIQAAIKGIELQPLTTVIAPACTKNQTSREVLDGIIAVLRHQHLQAVSELPENSPLIAQYERALAAAYEERAGMVYIRPPSAYLRSSFPSTSLQEDPNLTWHNMLTQQAWQAIPGTTQLQDLINGKAKQTALINAEIDKQYWQTINRVVVKGGGNTNYVLTRDDIGNWYVKNYEANPECVIQSAKNLALFAAGTGNVTELINHLSTEEGETTDAQETGSTRTASLLDAHEKEFHETLLADVKEVRQLLDSGLKNRIGDTWSADPLSTLLTKAADTNLKPAEKELAKWLSQPDYASGPGKLIDALHAIRRFAQDLDRGIDTLQPEADGIQAAEKTTAKTSAAEIVSSELTRWVERRREASEKYEQTAQLLSELIATEAGEN